MAREMKNSGIKWIGEIPKEWFMTKYKSVGSVLSGFPFNSENFTQDTGFPLIRIRDITSGCAGTFYSGSYPNNYIIHNGDFLLGMDGDFNVRWWNGGDALLNQRCCRLTLNENLYAKYIYYLIPYGLKLINDLAYSTTVKHLSVPDILNLNILTPPLPEQKAIADFLDKKCAEIDGLLADLEAEVKTLAEYKKSIIAETVTRGLNPNATLVPTNLGWIDRIPEHWGFEKFRYKLKARRISGHGDKQVLSVYREYGVILKESRGDNHNRTSDDTSNYKYVRPNDFVINKMKAWQGSMGVSEYEGIVSPAYFVYEFSDDDYNPRYFHYFMRNANNIPEYRRLSGGIREGQWDLSPYDLGNMPIVVPPKAEQDEIVNYLDKKCSAIEQSIADKLTQIETLKAYKASLIYEYVTGKKQVI